MTIDIKSNLITVAELTEERLQSRGNGCTRNSCNPQFSERERMEPGAAVGSNEGLSESEAETIPWSSYRHQSQSIPTKLDRVKS